MWKRDTTELVKEFIQLGFKTIVVCVKTDVLDENFAGREVDDSFLKDLPAGVDPCGENGEFHTFVFDGPLFQKPISFKTGNKIIRNYSLSANKNNEQPSLLPLPGMEFCFCDLIPE